jgi:hypothetical protein
MSNVTPWETRWFDGLRVLSDFRQKEMEFKESDLKVILLLLLLFIINCKWLCTRWQYTTITTKYTQIYTNILNIQIYKYIKYYTKL